MSEELGYDHSKLEPGLRFAATILRTMADQLAHSAIPEDPRVIALKEALEACAGVLEHAASEPQGAEAFFAPGADA